MSEVFDQLVILQGGGRLPGGSPATGAPLQSSDGSGNMAWGSISVVPGSMLYWTGIDGFIGRAHRDATLPDSNVQMTGTGTNPYSVCRDGALLFFGLRTTNAIGVCKPDGTGASMSFVTGCSAPTGITSDGTYIYWTNMTNNTIGRARIDGNGTTLSFITGCSSPDGIFVSGGFIYWTNFGTGAIGRAAADGTGVNQSFATTGLGANCVTACTVDASYIYTSNYAGVATSAGAILRAPIAGGAASVLFTPTNPGYHLAVDSTYIYWSAIAGNAIGRALLSGASPNQTFISTSRPLGVAVG